MNTQMPGLASGQGFAGGWLRLRLPCAAAQPAPPRLHSATALPTWVTREGVTASKPHRCISTSAPTFGICCPICGDDWKLCSTFVSARWRYILRCACV